MTAGAADMPVKSPRVVEQPQQVSGYVELYGGWARTKQAYTDCDPVCDSGGDTANGWALGGAGRATWWWAPNYSIQLDAQGEGTSYKYTGGNGGFAARLVAQLPDRRPCELARSGPRPDRHLRRRRRCDQLLQRFPAFVMD